MYSPSLCLTTRRSDYPVVQRGTSTKPAVTRLSGDRLDRSTAAKPVPFVA